MDKIEELNTEGMYIVEGWRAYSRNSEKANAAGFMQATPYGKPSDRRNIATNGGNTGCTLRQITRDQV